LLVSFLGFELSPDRPKPRTHDQERGEETKEEDQSEQDRHFDVSLEVTSNQLRLASSARSTAMRTQNRVFKNCMAAPSGWGV